MLYQFSKEGRLVVEKVLVRLQQLIHALFTFAIITVNDPFDVRFPPYIGWK
jgi:hypothetical protein